MSKCRCLATAFAVAVVLCQTSGILADSSWTAVGGYTTLVPDSSQLNRFGLKISTADSAEVIQAGAALIGQITPSSDLLVLADSQGLLEMARGSLSIGNSIHIVSPKSEVVLDGFLVRIAPGSNSGKFSASITSVKSGKSLFDLGGAKSSFANDATGRYLDIRQADVRISSTLAQMLGDDSLAGLEIGSFGAYANVVFAGGDEDISSEPVIAPSADPRAPSGPDVIVGGVGVSGNDGSNPNDWVGGSVVGGIRGYSVATTSCNIGNVDVNWTDCNDSGNPVCARHPVISQNMFRLKNGRFEQLGQSWLKHGFCALDQNLCSPTCPSGSCDTLGVGCSDPYTADRNTTNLGPKSAVNAFTGVFPYPVSQGPSGDQQIRGRLQVRTDDVNPSMNAGALYWVECMYTTQDDAAAGNSDNNASHRPIALAATTFNMSFLAATIQMQPAIREWKINDASVVETNVRVPNEGLMILAAKATNNGNGTWHYEYALFNQNSDRSARSFSVPIGGAVVTNIGFHDVDYHSGEPFSLTDWSSSIAGGFLTWSTETFAANTNANALRWGTLYNFRFDASVGPSPAQDNVSIGLFKPGTPTSVNALTVVPTPYALLMNFSGPVPSDVLPACSSISFDASIATGSETLMPGTALLNYRYDGGSFVTSPLESLGGNLYRATLPPCPCGSTPEFFISAQGHLGTVVNLPESAPTTPLRPQLGQAVYTDIINADFESGLPAGWSATGLWNATSSCPVTPAGCSSGQWAYYGDAGACTYATGFTANSGNLSTNLAIPSATHVELRYCSNFEREQFGVSDWPSVKIGATTVDQPAQGGLGSSGWVQRTVDLTAYAGQNVNLAFNFNTVDGYGNDYRGWQIDNVRVITTTIQCNAASPVVQGDLDGNGTVDGRDIIAFTDAAMHESTAPEHVCPGDFNADGKVSELDLAAMAELIVSQP